GEFCLNRLIVVDKLDRKTLHSRAQGFPVFSTRRAGLRDWWGRIRKPSTRTTSLFFPGAAMVSVRGPKESGLEPPYLEGWAESLARAGVDVDWILATDPWKLDGDQIRNERDHYLYGKLIEEAGAIRTEAREIVERGSRQLLSKSALVK